MWPPSSSMRHEDAPHHQCTVGSGASTWLPASAPSLLFVCCGRRRALDPLLVGEVLEAVRELKEEGMTIVMATHEMGFARDVADRVCFLDAGVVLEQGPPQEVLRDPTERRTRDFLARILG